MYTCVTYIKVKSWWLMPNRIRKHEFCLFWIKLNVLLQLNIMFFQNCEVVLHEELFSCFKIRSFNIIPSIYIIKISKSVSVYVCPAMRFVMLWCIELKLGMGVVHGPPRFVGIFSKRPHLGSKVIQGSICLTNGLWLPNLVRRTPDQSVVHCWGQRSCRGQLGSSRGQIA